MTTTTALLLLVACIAFHVGLFVGVACVAASREQTLEVTNGIGSKRKKKSDKELSAMRG